MTILIGRQNHATMVPGKVPVILHHRFPVFFTFHTFLKYLTLGIDLGIPHIPEIFDLGKFDLGIPDIPDIPHIPEIFDLGIFAHFFLVGFSAHFVPIPSFPILLFLHFDEKNLPSNLVKLHWSINFRYQI